MTTIERERYEAERRLAAIDATWQAIGDRTTGDVFSYMDIRISVWKHLEQLGYERDSTWSVGNEVEPLMRSMAKAGIILKVRAFDPPSKPHLFTLAP